jgi:hypothetical protein
VRYKPYTKDKTNIKDSQPFCTVEKKERGGLSFKVDKEERKKEIVSINIRTE